MNRVLLAAMSVLVTLAAFGANAVRCEQGSIHEAARAGDLATVRALVEKSPDLASVKDESGRTPLHVASASGHRDVVAYLLSKGGEVDALDNRRGTPLHQAAEVGHDEVARLLLESKAPIEVQDADGYTPLARASGYTPAPRTSTRGHVAVAARLLAAGASAHTADRWGRAPLLLVARESGNAELAALLIDAKADVNARDTSGRTPLYLAAWRGYGPVVDLLLRNGAALPVEASAVHDLLGMAVRGGLETLFARLVEAGAIITPARPGRRSLVHAAAAGGSTRIIEKLLSAVPDVNHADANGWTPLHDAAFMDRLDAVKFLLDKGADPDRRNRLGESAWNVAMQHKRAAIADLLGARGADRSAPRFPVLEGDYLGQKPPGRDPEAFAPDIVGGAFSLAGTIVFSPDGSEAYWSEMVPSPKPGFGAGRTMVSRRVNGRWTYPEVAMVGSNAMGVMPVISADGKRVYDTSLRALPGQAANSPKDNIWVADRTGTGWGEPRPLDETVNALPQHFQFALDREGGIYFSSNWKGLRGLFYSRFSKGRHEEAQPLGPGINVTGGEGAPFIAPDGSYLLFSRDMDIWVSFRGPDGSWKAPTALSPPTNSPAREDCPVVSPDGRILFYLRGGALMWVDASVIQDARPRETR
jgi:ankyrin repeat protein